MNATGGLKAMLVLVGVSAVAWGMVSAAGLADLPANIRGFAKWQKVVTTGLPKDGPHAGPSKVIYANPAAAKAWKGKEPLPVGSLVVKTTGPASKPLKPAMFWHLVAQENKPCAQTATVMPKTTCCLAVSNPVILVTYSCLRSMMKPAIALSICTCAVLSLSAWALAQTTVLPAYLSGLSSWNAIKILEDKPDDPHKGAGRSIYGNHLASSRWSGRAELPVGSVVAKVTGDPMAPLSVASMTKTTGGWRYRVAMRQADGSYAEPIGPRKVGSEAMCADCHSDAENDRLFSRE
jgi:hypothetical protein